MTHCIPSRFHVKYSCINDVDFLKNCLNMHKLLS